MRPILSVDVSFMTPDVTVAAPSATFIASSEADSTLLMVRLMASAFWRLVMAATLAVALSRFDMIWGASEASAPDSTETDDSAPRPSVSRTSRSVTRRGARCDCAMSVSSSAVLLISAITLTAVMDSISLPGASGEAWPALIWMALADNSETAEISATLSDGMTQSFSTSRLTRNCMPVSSGTGSTSATDPMI